MPRSNWPHTARHLLTLAVLAGALVFMSCSGDDSPTATSTPPPDDMGAMPPVPKPASLTSEAQSDTVTLIRPLKVAFAPNVYNARTDWRIRTRSCMETMWIPSCDPWTVQGDYPTHWMSDLPAMWNYRPTMDPVGKYQFMDQTGSMMDPGTYKYEHGSKLNEHRCGFADLSICWNNAEWTATFPQLTEQPYLCRDRYWQVAGKSQILPQGFSQEITTTVRHGVETTECQEWAVAVTVEGEVKSEFASLKTTIEASFNNSVTKTVFAETELETKYTPEAVPQGKQAVYQVWVLVDRYTLTDKNGKPFTDPNYKFGTCKRVHVQGVWEAHAITYFPSTAVVTAEAID